MVMSDSQICIPITILNSSKVYNRYGSEWLPYFYTHYCRVKGYTKLVEKYITGSGSDPIKYIYSWTSVRMNAETSETIRARMLGLRIRIMGFLCSASLWNLNVILFLLLIQIKYQKQFLNQTFQ